MADKVGLISVRNYHRAREVLSAQVLLQWKRKNGHRHLLMHTVKSNLKNGAFGRLTEPNDELTVTKGKGTVEGG